MFGGGGGSAGGGGTGMDRGGMASVYTPNLQPTADWNFWRLVDPMINASLAGSTPGQTFYPTAQDVGQKFLFGGQAGSPFDEGVSRGTNAVLDASSYGVDRLFPMGSANASALSAAGSAALPYASTALTQGFDPRYGQAITDIQNNPYYAGALSGATTAAGQGATGASSLMRGADALMASGFDPQQALFNRSQQRLLDQSNAVNAMSGVSGTPYGAGLTTGALSNFDIDWANNQLARQSAAARAAAPLYEAAPTLGARSAALPSSVYSGQIGDVLGALSSRNQAAGQGAAGFGSLYGGVGSGLTGAQNLGYGAANQLSTLGQAPYNFNSLVGSNAMQGLGNTVSIGNQQYLIPQQAVNDLESYMRLGQSASGISGQLGNLGLQQYGNAMSGLGSLAGMGSNLLFGNQGLSGALGLGSNGLFGSGGLFGGGIGGDFGGVSAFADPATLTPFGLAEFGGLDLGLGAGAAAGGGADLGLLSALALI